MSRHRVRLHPLHRHLVVGGAIASLGAVARMAVEVIEGFDDALVPLDDDVVPTLAVLERAA